MLRGFSARSGVKGLIITVWRMKMSFMSSFVSWIGGSARKQINILLANLDLKWICSVCDWAYYEKIRNVPELAKLWQKVSDLDEISLAGLFSERGRKRGGGERERQREREIQRERGGERETERERGERERGEREGRGRDRERDRERQRERQDERERGERERQRERNTEGERKRGREEIPREDIQIEREENTILGC